MLVVTKTPLRISLAGGGSDLPKFYSRSGGRVISCTIDKYIYLIVRPRLDGHIVVKLADYQNVLDITEVHHDLTRACLQVSQYCGGIEILSMSDVLTHGTGLGASSAFAVGLLHALRVIMNLPTDSTSLAQLACEAEIGLLKEPIGKQDQYAAACGGFNRFEFLPDGRVLTRAIEVSSDFYSILAERAILLDTGITRSSGSILRKWHEGGTENNRKVEAIKAFVPAVETALRENNIIALGESLHESWMQKRTLADTTGDSILDRLYERARDAGAIGGKVLGAGGGGYFFLLCPSGGREHVRNALQEYAELPFKFTVHGSHILYRDPRG